MSSWNSQWQAMPHLHHFNSQWQAMPHLHHFNPQTKQVQKAVEMPNSPEKKKKCHSAGKFGASVFWNAGIIHKEFMPQGTITEMNTYHDMLRCLHQAIHRKRIGHLSRDVTLDNEMPHSTQAEEFL